MTQTMLPLAPTIKYTYSPKAFQIMKSWKVICWNKQLRKYVFKSNSLIEVVCERKAVDSYVNV